MTCPHFTGEGGFPCSRCARLSLCCLPNNWKREDPALEYVLTSNSPKVRKTNEMRRTSSREDVGRMGAPKETLDDSPALLSKPLPLPHSFVMGRVSVRLRFLPYF